VVKKTIGNGNGMLGWFTKSGAKIQEKQRGKMVTNAFGLSKAGVNLKSTEVYSERGS